MQYSALLHAILLALFVFGLPHFLRHDDMDKVEIFTSVIMVPDVPNIKPPPQQMQSHDTHSTAIRPPLSTHMVTTRTSIPRLQQHIDNPPAHHEQQQMVQPSLDDILHRIEADARQKQSDKPTPTATTNAPSAASTAPFNPSLPLSMSEEDLIRQQIRQYWNAPVGAANADKLAVTLHIELAENGSVIHVELARDKDRYVPDSFFRAAADAAVRAVKRASPLKSLPTDKFATWGDMEMSFRLDDMR